MLQQKIDRITDILRRDDGISGAMHYTEQISWILFLKFLHDKEHNQELTADLEGKTYQRVLAEQYRWDIWACPKDEDGQPDKKRELTGQDLRSFVNDKLFPYLKQFNQVQDVRSLQYKIGHIFEYLDNRIASGHTLREVLTLVDEMDFQRQDDLFELSDIYERLLKGMGADGGNSGEFYTPRPVIKAIVQALDIKIGQTIYDGAVGSAGFLIESYEYLRDKYGENISTTQLRFLKEDTFFGNEKTPLAYIMGMMNMILHGIDSPNIYKRNTLTADIRDFQEKDRYDIIIANPPFGGKEKSQIQQNFPIRSSATELLFLQHFMKSLKQGGQAAIVVPEGVLFQSNNAFVQVKRELLENFNLHTIVSLPPGIFLPYSGVKTNIVFFSRAGGTSDVWYYEIDPGYKLTKNKPIEESHFEEFLDFFPKRKESGKSWTVKTASFSEEVDLTAKNPNAIKKISHQSPKYLLSSIKDRNRKIEELLFQIEDSLER